MNFKRFFSLNFLAKLLLSAIFVNAIPEKITNFGGQAQFITSRGFPEPLSSFLLVAAIALLISGSIFLVPTTIIFHLVPLQFMAIARNLSLIGGLLIVIDSTNVNPFNKAVKQESKEIEYSDLNEDN